MEHKIISLSIEPELLRRVEAIRAEHGGSRSQFWRSAMQTHLETLRSELPKGRIKGALLVIHDDTQDVGASVKHEAIVTAHLHSHLESECLEVFMLDGQSKRVGELLEKVRQQRGVRFAKLVL